MAIFAREKPERRCNRDNRRPFGKKSDEVGNEIHTTRKEMPQSAWDLRYEQKYDQ